MSVFSVTTLAAVLPRGPKRAAVALVAVAMGLSACGSDGEGTIPPTNADALIAQVDKVEAAVQIGDCTTAETEVGQLTGAVNGLPAEVGVKTKDDLRELTANLEELTTEQCEPDTGDSVDTGASGPAGVLEEEDG